MFTQTILKYYRKHNRKYDDHQKQYPECSIEIINGAHAYTNDQGVVTVYSFPYTPFM